MRTPFYFALGLWGGLTPTALAGIFATVAVTGFAGSLGEGTLLPGEYDEVSVTGLDAEFVEGGIMNGTFNTVSLTSFPGSIVEGEEGGDGTPLVEVVTSSVSGDLGTGTEQSYTITVDPSTTFLSIHVHRRNRLSDPVSVTANGEPCTLVVSSDSSNTGNSERIDVWRLANPLHHVSTGNQLQIAVEYDEGPTFSYLGVFQLKGVDLSDPVRDTERGLVFGQSIELSALTAAAGDGVVEAMEKSGNDSDSPAPQQGSSLRYLTNQTRSGAAFRVADASSEVVGWTIDDEVNRWMALVAAIYRAGGGGSGGDPGGPGDYQPDVVIQPTDDPDEVVDSNPAGTKYLFAPGDHYEAQWTPKNGDEYRCAEGAVVYGSRLLTSFQVDAGSGLYYASGQTQNASGSSSQNDKGKSTQVRAGYAEELFFDGEPLYHTNSKESVGPGEWYFDYSADRIYFFDDPSGHTVTTSTLRYACNGTASNVKFRFMVWREYADHAQIGGVNPSGASGWVIEDSEFLFFHGLSCRIGPDMEFRRNLIYQSGQLGIGGGPQVGSEISGVVVENNEFAENNRLFRWGWEGGATKFVRNNGTVIRGNYSHGNDGPGLWSDIDNINIVYEDNIVEDNLGPGIMHEISYDAVIRNNVLQNNALNVTEVFGGLFEIFVSASWNVEVYGNDLTCGKGGIFAIQQNRGSGPYGQHLVRNLYVHDNTVRMTSGSARYAGGAARDTGEDSIWDPDVGNNWWENNTYYVTDLNANNWAWDGGAGRNWAYWQGQGHDLTGSLNEL